MLEQVKGLQSLDIWKTAEYVNKAMLLSNTKTVLETLIYLNIFCNSRASIFLLFVDTKLLSTNEH